MSDISNVKLVCLNIQADIVRLNSICTHFINSSLSQGILPSSWRDNHITPLPKKQKSAHVPYTFRSISAIPAELKICERFVLSQIQPFVGKSNDQNQFAYKKARSTLDAVGLVAHPIAKSLDGGSKVQNADFVDFSSALNTIPRSQIPDRISSFPISPTGDNGYA